MNNKDIEVLEDLIEDYHMNREILCVKDIQAIENLIDKNKELEKENEILNNKQTKIIADSFHKKMAEKFDEDFIPKSKVRKKIEQIKMNANYDWIYKYDYQNVTKILEELLQEGDDK